MSRSRCDSQVSHYRSRQPPAFWTLNKIDSGIILLLVLKRCFSDSLKCAVFKSKFYSKAQMNIFQGITPSFFLFSFVNLRSFRQKGRHSSLSGFTVGRKLKIYLDINDNQVKMTDIPVSLDILFHITFKT